MSDSDYAEPSKRRRQESRSPTLTTYHSRGEKSGHSKGKQDQQGSHHEQGQRPTRRRSRDTNRTGHRKRLSSDDERKDYQLRAEHHERSRDRDSSRRPRQKRYERSRSPQGDRDGRQHRRRSRDKEQDSSRHRDRDRDRGWTSGRRRDRDRGNREDARGRRRSASPQPFQRSKAPLPSQTDAFVAKSDPSSALDKPTEKQKPNFGLSGKLAAASNTIQTANQTIVLKYHEPSEARKPSARDQWRLYVFKDDEILETVELSEQSCWLFGREAAVADFPIEHSSCSKQHAVIQFRYIEKRNEFGDKIGKVKPYIIDLESANGTSVNDEPMPAAKYMELLDKDVIKFGHSSREYVIQLPS